MALLTALIEIQHGRQLESVIVTPRILMVEKDHILHTRPTDLLRQRVWVSKQIYILNSPASGQEPHIKAL